jgi:NAD(P)-dependent dehydrogenase (short-subunit alcohol dehydrogenase family)
MSPVVAIAGAGGGLGPVVVGRLKADGWTVAGTDRDRDRCEGIGLDHVAVVDLLDEQAASGWAADVRRECGRVDALVHLVGGWRGGKPIDETPREDVELLHDLLVRTVDHATRAFLPALRDSGGRFVLVSSSQAQSPDATNAAYAAGKAAAEAWTLSLAADLAGHGGAANIVVVHAIGDAQPSFTPAEDIAEAIAFLLGEHGRRMNGQRLSLHG